MVIKQQLMYITKFRQADSHLMCPFSQLFETVKKWSTDFGISVVSREQDAVAELAA